MNKVCIIAEAGVNHNGDIGLAKELVLQAKMQGADIVKFQTFNSSDLTTKKAKKAEYQRNARDKDESQLKMLEKLELDSSQFKFLSRYCEENRIEFMSTAFDSKSIHDLGELNMKRWKIPSGEITNYPYLKMIGSMEKPIIMSTGMATMQEIEDALIVLKEQNANDIAILHCTTAYPTPAEEVNLKAMKSIQEKFNTKVGYSDHTLGIEVSIAAVAMGAVIIEKHITLDRSMDGPDHKSSLEPKEFGEMVSSIRNIEKAMGTGVKEPSQSELKNINNARKSIVALKKIRKGERYSTDNITTKRPGTGISPMHWNEIIGTEATRDYDEDDLLTW